MQLLDTAYTTSGWTTLYTRHPIHQKEHRQGAHLHYIGHYCLWHMASAMPDLQLPSQPKLVLIAPTHRGIDRLS